MYRLFAAVFSFSVLAVLVGCGQPGLDPALVAEHRTKLTLADEPDGAQTVIDVRNTMFGIEETAAPAHDEAAEGAAAEVVAEKPAADEHAADAGGEDAHDHGEAGDEHADHEHADHEHAEDGHEHAHDDHDHAHDGHDHAHADAAVKDPVIPEMDVVMVGSVGGVANPSVQTHPEFPFAKSQAMFFLADPETVAELEEHAHTHVHADGEECSFCAANADAAHLLAVVQFKGDDGKPLRVDARDLFDLKEKETVVVRGKARIAPGGMLTVDATGLYVRR